MRAANGRRGGLGLIRRPYTEVISSAFSLGGSTIAPFWPSRRSSTTQIAFQRATTMPLRANCWDLECLKSRIKHPHCILLIQRPYTKVKTSAFSLGRSTIAPFWLSRRSSPTRIAFQRATTMPLRANCSDLKHWPDSTVCALCRYF